MLDYWAHLVPLKCHFIPYSSKMMLQHLKFDTTLFLGFYMPVVYSKLGSLDGISQEVIQVKPGGALLQCLDSMLGYFHNIRCAYFPFSDCLALNFCVGLLVIAVLISLHRAFF